MHTWVENYKDFEAVLVCTNPLPPWESVSVMRGFATFQWSDATTSGDDPSFRHNDFGTIIRYEGGVLAIDYSAGGDRDDLKNSLPDLIHALYQLGWRQCEVYHPIETMRALLTDIGRAIPGNLDFDVKVAEFVQSNANIPEKEMLMDAALKVQSNMNNVMDEFRDLGAVNSEIATTSPSVPQVDVAPDMVRGNPYKLLFRSGRLAGPIFIDDEKNDEDLDMEQTSLADKLQNKFNVGEEPLVPSIDVSAEHAALLEQMNSNEINSDKNHPPQSGKQDSTSIRMDSIEAHLQSLLDQLDSRDMVVNSLSDKYRSTMELINGLTHDVRKLQDEPCFDKTMVSDLILRINDIEARRSADQPLPAPSLPSDSRPAQEHVVTVGRSVFCFDLPDARLSQDDAKSIFAKHSCKSPITVLSPNAIRQTMRWDVLGEIDPLSAWSGESLIKHLFPNSDTTLIVCMIRLLRVRNSFAGLRDLLLFAGDYASSMVNSMTQLSPSASALFAHARSTGALDRTIKDIFDSIGCLSHVQPGEAFVDILSPNGDDIAAGVNNAFTLRDIANSSSSNCFLIRLGPLDGVFAERLAVALQSLAFAHAKNTLHELKPNEETQHEEVLPPATPTDLAQIQSILTTLVDQVAKMSRSELDPALKT